MKRELVKRVLVACTALAVFGLAPPVSAHGQALPSFAALAEGRVPGVGSDNQPALAKGPAEDLSVQLNPIFVANRRPRVANQPPPAPQIARTELKVSSIDRCLGAAMTSVANTRAMQSTITFVPSSGIKPLRSEQLVVGADGAKLVLEDLALDTATLQLETRARAEVKLTKVEGGPGGFAVYGFRHDGVFEVVVPRGASLNVSASGLPSDDVRCAHTRVPLDAAGGGMAAFFSGTFTRTMRATWPRPRQPVTGRTWQVQIAASVSKTSGDREPVVAMTVSMANAEDEEPTAPTEGSEGSIRGGRVLSR